MRFLALARYAMQCGIARLSRDGVRMQKRRGSKFTIDIPLDDDDEDDANVNERANAVDDDSADVATTRAREDVCVTRASERANARLIGESERASARTTRGKRWIDEVR